MKIKSTEELLNLLKEEEVTEHRFVNVELKRSWTQEYGKKISMLANSKLEGRSYFIIGVEDNGTLSRHDEKWVKSTLEKFSQHLNQYLDPSVSIVDLITDEISGSNVIIAVIKNPGVVVKWNHKAYSGGGTTKIELKPEQILELNLSLPGLTDLTKQKISFEPDQKLVKIFSQIGNLKYSKKLLSRLHLDDTMCGALLMQSGKFRFIKYDTSGKIALNETRIGLINLVSDQFFQEIMTYYVDFLDENQKITDALLREALGNCLGHAAYHDNHGEIIVELHPAKLVISNLAYQEYISLANKWFSHAHKSPNPFLMEVLRMINRVDELGTGKKKLFSECISQGFEAPYINITDAGINKRWSLNIPIRKKDIRFQKLKNIVNELYSTDPEKALVAIALILWRSKEFSEITKYFDTYESRIAAEILSNSRSPVWYWEEKDKIILYRWVKVLLEEGKASKGFTEFEKEKLFNQCESLTNKYSKGLMTTKEFRSFARMSESSSDKVLASTILNGWIAEGRIIRVKKGTYKFEVPEVVSAKQSEYELLLKEFEKAFAKK